MDKKRAGGILGGWIGGQGLMNGGDWAFVLSVPTNTDNMK